MSVTDELVDVILSSLPDQFTSLMLEQKIEYYEHKWEDKEAFERVCGLIRLITDSEYEIRSEAYV